MIDLSAHTAEITEAMSSWASRDPEPEDLAQDIWLRLVEVAHLYDPARGSVAAFTSRVARSVWVSKMRKSTALKRTEMPDPVEPLCHTPQTTPRVSFRSWLRQTLDLDDIEPRRVYKLLSMGYTRAEICDHMDMTLYQVNQTKKRLRGLYNTYKRTVGL